jgi:hypothetical protein
MTVRVRQRVITFAIAEGAATGVVEGAEFAEAELPDARVAAAGAFPTVMVLPVTASTTDPISASTATPHC